MRAMRVEDFRRGCGDPHIVENRPVAALAREVACLGIDVGWADIITSLAFQVRMGGARNSFSGMKGVAVGQDACEQAN